MQRICRIGRREVTDVIIKRAAVVCILIASVLSECQLLEQPRALQNFYDENHLRTLLLPDT